ncbi:MAG: DUF4296 domain-containing protein [Saprospiraceae bacterium]
MKLDIKHLTRSRFSESGWTLNVGHWIPGLGFWAFVLSLSLFISCQSKPLEQPSIGDDKLARIMADLSIADAATTGLAGYRKDSLLQVYFKQVFEMHNVTLESYEKDLRIVAKDLSRMEAIVKAADELLKEDGKGGEEAPKN